MQATGMAIILMIIRMSRADTIIFFSNVSTCCKYTQQIQHAIHLADRYSFDTAVKSERWLIFTFYLKTVFPN